MHAWTASLQEPGRRCDVCLSLVLTSFHPARPPPPLADQSPPPPLAVQLPPPAWGASPPQLSSADASAQSTAFSGAFHSAAACCAAAACASFSSLSLSSSS